MPAKDSRKVASPRKTAKYYQDNPDARKKKAEYQKSYDQKQSVKDKKVERRSERRERGIDGPNDKNSKKPVAKKDMSHTKSGKLVAENKSTNRARNRGKK